MRQSQHFLENAENCGQLAERAIDEPTYKRFRRMEAAWRALAEEQDWLDGDVSPHDIDGTRKVNIIVAVTGPAARFNRQS